MEHEKIDCSEYEYNDYEVKLTPLQAIVAVAVIGAGLLAIEVRKFIADES